jgi:hypothetical protein
MRNPPPPHILSCHMMENSRRMRDRGETVKEKRRKRKFKERRGEYAKGRKGQKDRRYHRFIWKRGDFHFLMEGGEVNARARKTEMDELAPKIPTNA